MGCGLFVGCQGGPAQNRCNLAGHWRSGHGGYDGGIDFSRTDDGSYNVNAMGKIVHDGTMRRLPDHEAFELRFPAEQQVLRCTVTDDCTAMRCSTPGSETFELSRRPL